MNNAMLSNSQKKEILQQYKELDMHKELKVLFEKMYPLNTSVYITHGKDEMGRDILISEEKPFGTENTAVVVKMDKLSGSATDKTLFEICTQINQCFEVSKAVKDQLKPLKTDKVVVCIFGEISNKAQNNLDSNLKSHEGKIKYLDIEELLKYFTKYYPSIFLGASGLEALHKKYHELEENMLKRNKFLKTSYIEPNLRIFKKSKNQLLAISKSSDNEKISKTLGENIFGEKETIRSIAKKVLERNHKILIEGEAGSGKSIFVIKLTMYIIEETIKKIHINKGIEENIINIPIVIKATKFVNNGALKDAIENYYEESSSLLKPNLLIIDGMDEVNNNLKEKIIYEAETYCSTNNITLIFTTRKSTEVKTRLTSYESYELLPFETSQAINYIKKILERNQILVGTLIKGIEQLKHQIPLYPMALSLLIEIAEKHQEIPASISELYKRFIEMALGQSSDDEDISIIFEPNIKREFLESLSYQKFYIENISILDKKEFDEFLDQYIKKFPIITNKEIFLSELERTSLIKFDDYKVEFLHKSFLDYFIASYFNNRHTELYDNGTFNDIYKLYHSSLWEDVTYFYFGQKSRINKKEIDKIITYTPQDHNNLLKDINHFMIGKLIQYAWHTEFEDKKYAISLAINHTLSMRKGLSIFIETEIGMKLPKILGDIQMLHYIDEAFSSRFLLDEIKSITESMINNEIEVSDNLFYFSTIFLVENSIMLGNDYVKKYLDKFIELSYSITPDVTLPLINIISLYIKNNKLIASEEQSKNIKDINHKLKRKYEKLTYDYLTFKNKIDQLRISKIGKK